jgi:transcriptional regulator with XRE-family HTH domain
MVHILVGERILGFERGASEPNPRMLLALAEALAMEPMQLLLLPNGVDLEALRLVSGLSAADVAQSAHVSLRSYLECEAGHCLPLANERILAALARRLDVSPVESVNVMKRREAANRERGDSHYHRVCGEGQSAHSPQHADRTPGILTTVA